MRRGNRKTKVTMSEKGNEATRRRLRVEVTKSQGRTGGEWYDLRCQGQVAGKHSGAENPEV